VRSARPIAAYASVVLATVAIEADLGISPRRPHMFALRSGTRETAFDILVGVDDAKRTYEGRQRRFSFQIDVLQP
jgi:hypothetical protein